MRLFSKSKSDKDSEIILSEFPSWAAIHSAMLVNELQVEDLPEWTGILKDDAVKSKFINCLIGAHMFYLCIGFEGGVLSLFGENIIEELLFILPEESKKVSVLALYKEKTSSNNDEPLSSIEEFYGIEIDPIDANIAFVIEQEMYSSKEFSGLIGYLLPILNRLRVGQLEWLKGMVDKWSITK